MEFMVSQMNLSNIVLHASCMEFFPSADLDRAYTFFIIFAQFLMPLTVVALSNAAICKQLQVVLRRVAQHYYTFHSRIIFTTSLSSGG